MADKRSSEATQDKPESGKRLQMITLPTLEIFTALDNAAKAKNVSRSRYILDLIAAEFNITLPTIRTRRGSMRSLFESEYPRAVDESDTDYNARFAEYKSRVQAEANKKRAARVKESMDLMSQLKAAAESGTLTELNLEELRERLLRA